MPRRTKEDAEKTKQHLIRSALMVFSEKGVANTRLADIVKAAGVTKGAFYWHFEDKAAIFNAISEAYTGHLDQQMTDILEQAEEPLAGIFEALSYYCEQIQASEELIALFTVSFYKCEYTGELAPRLKLDQQEIKEHNELFQQTLERLPTSYWQQEQVGDCEQIATALIDIIVGVLMRWLREQQENRQRSLANEMIKSVKMVLRGNGLVVE